MIRWNYREFSVPGLKRHTGQLFPFIWASEGHFFLSPKVGMSFCTLPIDMLYLFLFFGNTRVTCLLIFSLFQVQEDKRYVDHVALSDIFLINSKINPFLLSSLYWSKMELLIYFSVIQLKPPVGNYWLIAHPYRLFASRYMIYFECAFLL